MADCFKNLFGEVNPKQAYPKMAAVLIKTCWLRCSIFMKRKFNIFFNPSSVCLFFDWACSLVLHPQVLAGEFLATPL